MQWIDLAAELPELRGGHVHVLPSGRAARVRSVVSAHHFRCFTLDGDRAIDEAACLAELSRGLGFPKTFGHNWDAVVDSLGDVVAEGGAHIAILWTAAERSAAASLSTFVRALLALEAAARDVGDQAQVEIFLFADTAS